MVANFIWDLPGPKSGAAGYLAGGWELGAIVTATTGSPFTPTIGGGGGPLGTGVNGDFSMGFPNLGSWCKPLHRRGPYLNTHCFPLAQATPPFAAPCGAVRAPSP